MNAGVVIAVLVAGAIGALLRYGISLAFAGKKSFPWAVLVVNTVGSALGGTLLGLADAGHISSDLHVILLTGIAGGLTTFSTWSVETIQLVLEKKTGKAVANIGVNLVVGLLVATAAFLIAGAL